ncbi:MAG: YjjG family noncanonical pyrimidine nucleotidase [Prevotellaceae bacterium]|jgi:putative hydrolase of the HAD superfamily|nr:YjjG family noncanonical pyrimidine nucleotidase [Prevotellaceae bacterium]
MAYKNLFFDLDDTLWAFSQNAHDTFVEMYNYYGYDRFFESFDHFYELYEARNGALWNAYGNAQITKEELNRERFRYPLQTVGIHDDELANAFAADFFNVVTTKTGLMPHAQEVLEYLSPRYNLYILSNGFRELQGLKMQAAGIDHYFKQVILSEDIGVLKPNSEIFYYALSSTQSELSTSLMIGDNWVNDMVGAKEIGLKQAYYNVNGRMEFPFKPTHLIDDLIELCEFL